MLNSVCKSAKVFSSLSLALLVGAAFTSPASAQTILGPQLLPLGPVTVFVGGAASSPTTGALCATGSTLHSTDTLGDGCLGTQVALSGPRYVIQDTAGNFFITDTGNNVIRRVDATTGIISTVAGGAATSPAQGSPCGLNASTDIFGDGCNSPLVALSKPEGIAFSPSGDLYIVDGSHDVIRKVAATSGLVPATGGVITNVAGFAPATGAVTYGYIVSNSTTAINASTQSVVDGPFGLAFDKNGVLYAADEFVNAIYAINVTTTDRTIYGVTVKAGQIWKVVGAPNNPQGTKGAGTGGSATATPQDCLNGTGSGNGCGYFTAGYVEGGAAGANPLDAPYGIAFDPTGNLFIANEFTPDVPVVSPAGLISTYVGPQTGGTSSITSRAAAATNISGSTFGITADTLGVVYFTDAFNGVVWRVDPDTKVSYVVAGGATTVCSGATDAAGDGCPSLQATFGKTGTKFASATAPGPGIFGITEDKYNNLYVGDTTSTAIRQIGTGTNFGIKTTSTVTVHYFKGDTPKANGYVVASTTTGTTFSAVPGNCVSNTDGSQDCPVVLTSVPTALGPYSGTLTVSSTSGTTMTYPLSGIYQPTPVTTTKLTITPSTSSCSGSSNYATTTSFVLTATISSVGGSVAGQVQFYNNGIAIPGALVTPVANVATYTATFANTGNYSITAKFLGDSYFTASTSAAQTFTLLTPTLYLTANTASLGIVKAGQTALYSFNTVSSVYGGAISFACTGLPANSSCVFSPSTITSDACGTGATIALSIYTKSNAAITTSGVSGRGLWPTVLMFAGLASALLLGLRRRRLGSRLTSAGMAVALLMSGMGLMSCADGVTPPVPSTPLGAYTVTVNALPAGTPVAPTGQSQSVQFTLVVN